jgi:phosphomevalonate kinase
MSSIRLRVPGKLLLLGEYAILEPGSQALVLAVNRYLTLEVHTAERGFTVQTDLFPDQDFVSSGPGQPLRSVTGQALPFVEQALTVACAWLQTQELTPEPLQLQLSSELQQDGVKLGLGSSAATTLAVIAGVLMAHDIDCLSPAGRLRLFKLAALAHSGGQQGAGSGADLAGCLYGSVTCYRRFDPRWLQSPRALPALINSEWPLLGLEKLPWPDALGVLVGWSGAPAMTVDYLTEFEYVRQEQPEALARFLFSANATTAAGRAALCKGDLAALTQAVGQYRRLLNELSAYFLEPIETPALHHLIETAAAQGLGAKSSGAGGGDCALAVGSASALTELALAWRGQGLQPLELTLDSQGLTLL